MKYLTLKRLMSWEPCHSEETILKLSGGRKRISIDDIFDMDIEIEDKIWLMLHEPIFDARELRLMACEFVEMILPTWVRRYPDDDRPQKCIEVARRYANGVATEEELSTEEEAAAWATMEVWAESWVAGAATWAEEAAMAEEAAAAATAATWASRVAWVEVAPLVAATADMRQKQLDIIRKYWRSKQK